MVETKNAVNDYNTKNTAYNNAVNDYNTKNTAYNSALADYNDKIMAVNQLRMRGILQYGSERRYRD